MASISKVLNRGSVWLLYTFRLLQILVIGSFLLGCAKAPPGPPWMVSNSIEVKPLEEWEKLAQGRIVFLTTACCLSAWPPSGTRELLSAAPKYSGSTTRSFGEELGSGFMKALITPVAIPLMIIAAPVMIVHKAAKSVSPAEKPTGQTRVAAAETPAGQTPMASSEQITLRQKYLSWTEEIAAQDQYLSELNASFIEAFKIERRAQANSEPANRNTAQSGGVVIVQLGMSFIRLLVPEDGTMPFLTSCANAREVESSRAFQTCYSTKLATNDPAAANTETFKAALALHAKKLAEMQATDLTADVQKSNTPK